MVVDWDQEVLSELMGELGNAEITYRPASGAPYAVEGIFEAQYQELKIIDDVGVTTVRPALGVQLSQFRASPVQNDKVSINCADAGVNSTYVVREVRPDGYGFARLMLNLVSSP
jgi:hypothetical protein